MPTFSTKDTAFAADILDDAEGVFIVDDFARVPVLVASFDCGPAVLTTVVRS